MGVSDKINETEGPSSVSLWTASSGKRSGQMQNKSPARSMLLLALGSCAFVWGEAGMLARSHAQVAGVGQPCVQITSVMIEPTAIHKSQQPSKAKITVQVLLQGQAPPNSTARIDIGTYSNKPSGNNVNYGNQSRIILLKDRLNAAEFSVESTPESLAGKVVVAATIFRTTKGVNIKPPDEPKNWLAELVISDP